MIATEPAKRTVTVRVGTFRTQHRDVTSPGTPPDASRSPDLRILAAWIEAELAHPGDLAAILQAIETAVRQVAEGTGRRSLGRYYHQVPPRLRPLLGQRDGDGLKALLGDWPRAGAFRPGLADLTERQAQAYWLRIRGWSPSAIACEMTPSRQRFDRRLWLSVQTVYNYCFESRLKVLAVFGLPPSADPDEATDG